MLTNGHFLNTTQFILFVADVATGGLDCHCRQLKDTQKSAYAFGTYNNLQTQIRSFLLFCEYYDLKDCPVNFETLCLYAKFLSRNMKSVHYIKNFINGVRLYHVFKHFQFPEISNISLHMTFRGMLNFGFIRLIKHLRLLQQILLQVRDVILYKDSF